MFNPGVSVSKSFYTGRFSSSFLPSTYLFTAQRMGAARLLRGEILKEMSSDLEKLLAKGGAGGEIVVAYAISITSRPSNKGGGDEWRKYVPLISALRAKADTRSIVN